MNDAVEHNTKNFSSDLFSTKEMFHFHSGLMSSFEDNLYQVLSMISHADNCT